MNNLNKFETSEEIKNEILQKISELGTIRISSINCKCMDETVFMKALEELTNSGIVAHDETFIFKPEQNK